MASDDRGTELVAVTILFLALSLIFTGLRFYARAVVVRHVGSDDYLAFASQFCYILMCVFCIVGVHYGIGKRGFDIPHVLEGGAVKPVLFWWLGELSYLTSGVLLKLSMAIFLLRIATSRPVRLAIYGILVATILATAYFMLQFIFQCWPVEYFWERLDIMRKPLPVGKCVREDLLLNSAYAYSAVTCAVDFALCIVPIVMVSKLQLTRRTKMSVMGVLSLWCVASITTFIRMPYLGGLKGDAINFLYNTSDLAIWSLCEAGIGIICVAIATLRPLMAKSFFKSSTSTSQSRTNGDTWAPQSRSRSAMGFGAGGMGRGSKGYIRSGKGSGTMTVDEEIGVAVGSDSESLEMSKRPGVAVTREARGGSGDGHGREGSFNEAMGLGTTTYVSALGREGRSVGGNGDEREAGEGMREADFVYGYGIRRTTVVTTERE